MPLFITFYVLYKKLIFPLLLWRLKSIANYYQIFVHCAQYENRISKVDYPTVCIGAAEPQLRGVSGGKGCRLRLRLRLRATLSIIMPYTMNEKDTQDLFKITSISLATLCLVTSSPIIVLLLLLLLWYWYSRRRAGSQIPSYPPPPVSPGSNKLL